MKIKSERVYLHGCFVPGVIDISGRTITEVSLTHTAGADMDFGNARIVPGFIDIHCHGAYGFDTNYADPEGLKKWSAGIPSEGVTGFLATTVTEKKEVLLNAVKNVNNVMNGPYSGAEILGIHFEGPYLDMKYKGAQPPEAIAVPDAAEFREYQEAAGGNIRIITMAPEHDQNRELLKYCVQTGVIVSIGHSGASFEQTLEAAANGASSITHTFNAMSPFTHRSPGIAGAALRLRDMYSEIICDCCHSTPEALNIFFRAKNLGKAIMVSDSLMCKGYAPGTRFLFGGHEIEIYPDGSAHLAEEKNLAGSTMKMNEGLRNLVEKAMVPFDTAVDACTVNPASLLGLDQRIGRISAGFDADITVLNDDYSVRQTFCKGIPQL